MTAPKQFSPAFQEYASAFEMENEPFLFYYKVGHDHTISREKFTRKEFLSLARKAAGLLKINGCRKGHRILHCFGANDFNDLAFRLASSLIGTIPVTVNWQADPLARMIYKFEDTDATMVVHSPSFDSNLLHGLKSKNPNVPFLDTHKLEKQKEIAEDEYLGEIDTDFTKIIIYTSGTTGNPKGVELTYRNYSTNRDTFEQMLEIKEKDRFAVLIVNPMHHTNSTAITDWALRRPGSHIHLIERYSSKYWKILKDVADEGYDRIVAPTVSRHFDFLETLSTTKNLDIDMGKLKKSHVSN